MALAGIVKFTIPHLNVHCGWISANANAGRVPWIFSVIMVQTPSPSLSCNVTFPLREFLNSVKVKKRGKVQNALMFLGGWLTTLQIACPSFKLTHVIMWTYRHLILVMFHFGCFIHVSSYVTVAYFTFLYVHKVPMRIWPPRFHLCFQGNLRWHGFQKEILYKGRQEFSQWQRTHWEKRQPCTMGCLDKMWMQVLDLHRHIVLICLIQVKHCNQYVLHVHGKEKPCYRSAFTSQLSKGTSMVKWTKKVLRYTKTIFFWSKA